MKCFVCILALLSVFLALPVVAQAGGCGVQAVFVQQPVVVQPFVLVQPVAFVAQPVQAFTAFQVAVPVVQQAIVQRQVVKQVVVRQRAPLIQTYRFR